MSGMMGRVVVVDTATPLVYIGTLREVGGDCLVMDDVDVHDVGDTPTTKEIYVMESKKFGVRKNRRRVVVFLKDVVSVSLLEDVIVY